LNEPIALGRIEPLHGTFGHYLLLQAILRRVMIIARPKQRRQKAPSSHRKGPQGEVSRPAVVSLGTTRSKPARDCRYMRGATLNANAGRHRVAALRNAQAPRCRDGVDEVDEPGLML
jgi:hypothetical protein